MPQFEILRYAAFTDRPEGGNPAGIVLDAQGLDAARMLAIAADVGYAETAFLLPRGEREFAIRYFSPQIEVPFCGHATIATAVALAERDGIGPICLHTAAGLVAIDTHHDGDTIIATLTSVPPHVEMAAPALVEASLKALSWAADELDTKLPPRIGYAGARDLFLFAATRERLARLDYDFEALRSACLAHDVISVVLVWRESTTLFHVRSPFPVGGVVEDPATGSAAAALGAYLRELGELGEPGELGELGEVTLPTTLTLRQGEDMGRPSVLTVTITDQPGIRVSGRAVPIK